MMIERRLLAIDDDPNFGEFIRRAGTRRNFEVKITTDPREFQTLYVSFDPSLIILDIAMPEVDGIELVRWLATKNCAGRVIIASAFDPIYAVMAEKIGALAGLVSISRLSKPVSLAELEIALE
jgi:DNA-binding response OmpR family regulator